MKKFAHIINPVKVGSESDLHKAQSIVFETFELAVEFAKNFDIEVELYSAQYAEDHQIIPDIFKCTPDLQRSVIDLGRFKEKRKLPILQDILGLLYSATDAEYLVYTNVDIGLMPFFYPAISNIIDLGFDSFVINRRTISADLADRRNLNMLYAEVGDDHPGHDCFIFRRDAFAFFHLGNSCIGINWVGRILLWNLICWGKNFKEFDKLHLTFHIGNEKRWKNPNFLDYVAFNKIEATKVYNRLKSLHPCFFDELMD